MNCTLLSSCPNDGSSNAPSDGWKNAEGSGRTANGNSIPACNSSTLPSSSSYSEDREQALTEKTLDLRAETVELARIPRGDSRIGSRFGDRSRSPKTRTGLGQCKK